MSYEHFTVDGTLIEAWALWALLLKSVTSTKPSAPAAPPDDPGNPTVNFHSDWWCTNVTHQSTTDPEARLTRKSTSKEATLSFSGHVSMCSENRHGLCVDLLLAPATGTAERDTALAILRCQAR